MLHLASVPMLWPLSFPSLVLKFRLLSSTSVLTGKFLEIYLLKLTSRSLIKNSGSSARNWGMTCPVGTLTWAHLILIWSPRDISTEEQILKSAPPLEVAHESDERTWWPEQAGMWTIHNRFSRWKLLADKQKGSALIYRLIAQPTKVPGPGILKLLLGLFEAPLESTASFLPLALFLYPLSTQFSSGSSCHTVSWSLCGVSHLPRSTQIALAMVHIFMAHLLTNLVSSTVQTSLHLSTMWEGDEHLPASLKKKRTPTCFPCFPLAVSTVASRADQDDHNGYLD